IADHAGARPLRVQMRLRIEVVALVGDELALDELGRLWILLAVHRLDVRRAAAPDLIHDVDGVALRQEILRPAVTAIDGAVEARARGAAALDHDDRIGMRAVHRDLVLDIGLPGEDRPGWRVDIFAADEEIALLGDGERPYPFGGGCAAGNAH